MNAPSQWETTLHCNVVSHWPGTYTKWSLHLSWWDMLITQELLTSASVYAAFICPALDQSCCSIDIWGIIILHEDLSMTCYMSFSVMRIDFFYICHFSMELWYKMSILMFKHIEAKTKWAPFRRWHFFFLNEYVLIATCIKVPLKFAHKGPINNIPALVQKMAWRRQGDKPLSEAVMVNWLMHIHVTWPQWVYKSIQYAKGRLKCGITVKHLI